MQAGEHETVTIVKVSFSDSEWDMLASKATGSKITVTEYIHQVVMRNLRRRKAEPKKVPQP